MSKSEEKIITLLQKSQYRFEREKRFSDLKQGLYRFDFYIYRYNEKALLEYNGEQHYQFIKKFYRTRTEFESAKERDRRKISYCLANDIPLYIIPYWELDHLYSAADLFQPRFRANTRWKNDQDYQRFKKI